MALQFLSRSSLHHLAGLSCRLFLSYGLQVVTRVVHKSSLRRLICPAQDLFISLRLLIVSMTFVLSLTEMLFFLYLYVMLIILHSILVCIAASLCYACLVSVQVSAPYVIGRWQNCLWRYPSVWRMPPSLPWFFFVSLCPVFFTLGCSFVPSTRSLGHFLLAHCSRWWGVLSTTITFVFAMFIFRPICLLSYDSSCSIYCNYCGVSVHKNMSSAKTEIAEKLSVSLHTLVLPV